MACLLIDITPETAHSPHHRPLSLPPWHHSPDLGGSMLLDYLIYVLAQTERLASPSGTTPATFCLFALGA